MFTSIDVSIIIVSWNVAKLLENCLESIILYLENFSFEIFVIDNASMDDSVQMLYRRFPNVHVIANKKNIGFARANNQALRHVKGRFVLILNPDTIMLDGALKKMIDFMADHPEVGMIGPCLSYPNGEIQNTCARLLPTLKSRLFFDVIGLYRLPLIGRWFSKNYGFPYNYNVSQEVEAISGAAMVVRHEVLKTTGGFGESFIHCGEDIDLCFRVRKAGWKIYYLCNAHVIHFSGQSSQQAPVRTLVNSIISAQEYLNRCFGRRQGLLYRFIIQFIYTPMIMGVGCAKVFLGYESNHQFKQRLETAKAIWSWRTLE